jgi:hypothetical protein
MMIRLPVEDSSSDVISVGDVLGPLIVTSNGQRDSDFSLLSYSFNLCPVIREQISTAMCSMIAEYEIGFNEMQNIAGFGVLPPLSVISRRDQLTLKLPRPHDNQNQTTSSDN